MKILHINDNYCSLGGAEKYLLDICDALEEAGFKRHKEFKPLPVICVPLSSEIDKEYLMIEQNWHLTYSNIDGFCE